VAALGWGHSARKLAASTSGGAHDRSSRRRTRGSGERGRRPRDVRETVKMRRRRQRHTTRGTATNAGGRARTLLCSGDNTAQGTPRPPRWVSTATGVAPLPAWYNHRRVSSEVPQRGTRFRGGFAVRIPCSPSRLVYQTWCWFEVNARIHVYYL
jgi:hypothetical protein